MHDILYFKEGSSTFCSLEVEALTTFCTLKVDDPLPSANQEFSTFKTDLSDEGSGVSKVQSLG